jgi:hypothetical protein
VISCTLGIFSTRALRKALGGDWDKEIMNDTADFLDALIGHFPRSAQQLFGFKRKDTPVY